jgi:hypothetical protein
VSGNSLITGNSYIGVTTAYLSPSSGGILFNTGSTTKMTLNSSGNFGVGITPTAVLHLKAGTATASTAPIKLTSGTLLTTPEIGSLEFLTDRLYFTISTGTARKSLAYTTDYITSFSSNTSTNGQLLSSNGSGGSSWVSRSSILLTELSSNTATSTYVPTANGSGGIT